MTRSAILPVILALGVSANAYADSGDPPRGPDFDNDGFEDAAIGVPGDSETVAGGGAINVLYGDSSGPITPILVPLRWDQDTYYYGAVEGVAEAGDDFGRALAWGDFNGDCYDDLAIGVPGEDIGTTGYGAGAVNVLYGSAHGLTADGNQVWHGDSSGITNYDADPQDLFGDSLAAGDFNSDGTDDLAIGIPSASNGNPTNSGGVLVLYGSGNGLTSSGHQYLRQYDPQPGDRFGAALTAGQFDCERDALVVGSPDDNVVGAPGSDQGSVSVFYQNSSLDGLRTTPEHFEASDRTLSQGTHGGIYNIAIAGDPEPGDNFGASLIAVALPPYYSCDALVVGVPNESVGSIGGAGAVNIIYTSGLAGGLTTGTNQLLYAGSGLPGPTQADARVGSSLAVGRVNDDGYNDIIIGAPQWDSATQSDTGAMYVVPGDTTFLDLAASEIFHQGSSYVPGGNEAYDYWSFSVGFTRFQGPSSAPYILVGAVQEEPDVTIANSGAASALKFSTTSSLQLASSGSDAWFQDYIEGTTETADYMGFSLPAPRQRPLCE